MSAPSSCPDSTALVRQIVDYFISGLLIGVEPSATFCRSPSKSSFRRQNSAIESDAVSVLAAVTVDGDMPRTTTLR